MLEFVHMTDSHAQLLPVYFREPSVNLVSLQMKISPLTLLENIF